jgi:D-beta-D-heptose 7-phosphate kinase/D-beta-D-heptose 1-phosphate adenosyltransferase
VDPCGLVTDPGRPTTVKFRVLARGQQVIRVDTETAAPLTGGQAELLAAWAERTAAECDGVLLSDYGKGAISAALARRVIDAARRAGRPVVVDPKGTDPGRYRGATVVKPNAAELGDLTGRRTDTPAALLAAGNRLAEDLSGTAVLVTRGPDGLAVFRHRERPLVLRAAPARRVFDVTGAGDTTAAALALALAAGVALGEAARVANAAAGVAVGKVATAVVTPAELAAALAEDAPGFDALVR